MTDAARINVAVLVQARSGSARLPGKSLRSMCGTPMILHVMRRAAALGYPAWMATSVSDRDDLLADTVREAGFPVHRGSEWDVLDRMAGAAAEASADIVVRVTADCPLWAPDVAGQVLAQFLGSDQEGILTNDTTQSGWPDGTDTEVFSAALLFDAANRSTDRLDREHVTPWMRRNAQHWVIGNGEDWRDVKLSVDTAEDFERARAVMADVPTREYRWAATRAALLRQGYNFASATGGR